MLAHLTHLTHLSSRFELLEQQPKGGIVAEVGVHSGDFAKSIFDIVQPDILYLADSWPDEQISNGAKVYNGLDCKKMVEDHFHREIKSGRVRLIRDRSVNLTEHIEAGTLDWFYLDTSHWYPATLHELRVLRKLLKPNGTMFGHDYNYHNTQLGYCGVERAVQEYLVESDLFLSVLTSETDSPISFGIKT